MLLRILVLIILFLSACSPKVATVQSPPKPEWLKQKPVSNTYYYGIGQALKDGKTNHLSAAKNSALEDLISEIRVTVSATSALSILDAGKEFTEKYEQIIRTSVADDIEDFELAGSWEDENNYWVWYRLSKQRYQEIKENRKQAAASLALDFYLKAKKSEQEGNIALSIGFYLKALHALEKYLNEPVRVTAEGKEILINNEIITGLQLVLNRIGLSSVPTATIIPRRQTRNTEPFYVEVLDKQTGKQPADIPLKTIFEKGSGDLQKNYKTDLQDRTRLIINRITSEESEQIIKTQVDLESFVGNNTSEIAKLVLSRMLIPSASVTLTVKKPLIYLTADEKILGNPKSGFRITNFIRTYLTSKGFDFTDKAGEAELHIDISSNTEKGGISGSIQIVLLDAVIRILETGVSAKKEIYSLSLDRIKGYSLDFERSSQDAYTKAIDILEKDKLPAMMSIILQ